MDVFIILQLSATDFRVRAKNGNNNIARNPSRLNILTLLLSADAKSAVLLRVSSLAKVEVHNFPLLLIPNGSVWLMDKLLCLYDM